MKRSITLALTIVALGCSVDEVPDGLKKTPKGEAATVRWDLYHKPLPDIPFPNDQAMWPDPTSRTGIRVNASEIAPTNIEETAREKFNQLEGFGTYAPISVSFEKLKKTDARAAIDLKNVIKRHQGDDYELENDAIYVVNLDTGIPALIDVGEGSFQYVVREKGKYWRNDTRASEQNLMWETADETIDPASGNQRPGILPNEVPAYKPEWDTDFDGVLDRPNLLDPDKGCPNQVNVALGTVSERDRDRCFADKLLTFYERETDTLMLRPLIPLEEKTQYAVVITDRLLDADGNPVKSPFDFVYHPNQEEAIARLKSHLSNADLKDYYGDIGGTGLEHVSFAWTFTTQPVTEDLRLIRDGLYGKGPLASFAKKFPADATAARAAGLVALEDIPENGEPDNWQSDPKCVDAVKLNYIVKIDAVKNTVKALANSGFGFSGPTLDTLIKSFDAIDYIMIGSFKSPFLISGGPTGTDPNASFDMDFRTGEGKLYTDTVQFLLTVPKETATRKQPFPVAYYGHGYTSSSLEVLGFAGHLAAQGIAAVGMNATFHGLELGKTDLALAEGLFGGVCEKPFASALLSGRARDLNGDGTKDSGGDYWTSYLFHTRDVVRQSAIDLLQMFRVFKGFDGKKKTDQDFNNDGENDLAGDFDGNGTPDIGGPNPQFFAWGQSLGGILAPFVAALDPNVLASAPTSGAGGLLDVGARTFQGGAFEGIYLRNFGPLVVGVPAKEFYDANNQKETACSADQVSLRFVVVDVNEAREVEFHCIEKAAYAGGGTVFVTNAKNGKVHCARMDSDGRFRIGIPASIGDKLEVQVWDQPDAVDNYDGDHGCNATIGDEHRIELINTWGDGVIPQDAKDPSTDKVVCTASGGCSKFQNKYIPSGSTLISIAEGFGQIRQTPSLRRFMSLASNIVDPGDPVNYAPFYALKPITDPDGNLHPPKGMLNVVTVGDMNVPLNSGIALGRVAGALPFLVPGAEKRYPVYSDYVTPQDLYSALNGKTPNRYLIEHHVVEGINRLERESPGDLNSCGANEPPVSIDLVCHPNCPGGDTKDCLDGQVCIADRCQAPPISPEICAQYLFDPDALDEGLALYGNNEAPVPLRPGRISMPVSMPATPGTIDAVWEPRLKGKPRSSDFGAWKADRRVVAQLEAYINPTGVHGFDPADPCQAWDSGQYMINLITRFFASGGADVYYLSHPSSHQCLAKPVGQGACPFYILP